MSTQEQIGKLQDLLERVQMRAAAPRGNGTAAHAAPVAQAAAPAYATPSPPPVDVEVDSIPPITRTDGNGSYEGAEAELGMDAEVEISSETVEVDIDIDEPMPLESGAQPVAQATMPPEDLEEEEERTEFVARPSMEAEQEEVTQTAPANEIEEPTPSSSRRPIAGEEAEAAPYEEESAPRHTPPPESGKQVAAAPSAHPPPSRKPSVPPPSLEGHTLVGGWREPGLGQLPVAPGASAGVRVPAPPPEVAPAQASGTRLSPDVTRPALAAGGAGVATFQGAPPVAKPATLGELLDMTLSL